MPILASDVIGLDKRNPLCPEDQNSSTSPYKVYGLGLAANKILAGEALKDRLNLRGH
jgi:hypothetical protein